MNIVWITNRFAPDKGGMAVSCTRLVHGLRDAGHRVQVIHLTYSAEQAQQSRLANRPSDQRVTTVQANRSDSIEQLFWHMKTTLTDSVIVGFGGGQPGYLAALWAKWCFTKSLVLLRGNDFEKKIHDVKQASVLHFILDQADVVGCVSQEMTERVRTLRRLPTVFTPNSIDLSQWSFLDQDHQRAGEWKAAQAINGQAVVGMVGQLKAKKGLDVALSLFSSFGFQERACLLTVGDVPEPQKESLGALGQGVHFAVPFVFNDQLPSYYAAMDVVLIPSYYDGMPNVLLESMALGRLVVASKAGAIPDVVTEGQTGFLFEIGDCADAARALDKALSLDESDYAGIVQRARQHIEEQFSPTQERKNIVKALTETRA